MTEKKQYSYDSSCADLAEHFLVDSTCPKTSLPDEIAELAKLIQDTIESHLNYKRFESR